MPSRTKEPSSVADPDSLLMLITVVSSGGSERECARLLATGISSLVPCRLCWIALRSPTAEQWQVMDSNGKAPPFARVENIGSELNPLYEATMNHGTSLLIDTGDDSGGLLVPPSLAKQGIESLTAVPLMTLRDQLGLLIAERQDGECFSPGEVSLFETLTQHLAVAIENFRLSESLEKSNRNLQQLVDDRTSQLRRSDRRQRALLEINNAIVANLDRESLFNAVAESIGMVVHFHRVSLVLHEPERDELKVYGLAGSANQQYAPVGSLLPNRAGYVEKVLEEKRPHIRSDLRVGDRTEIEEMLLKEGHRSYILVPLIGKTRVLGTLNFASHAADQYSSEDAEFLLEVGKQVALAIENMLAYEKIDELQRQLALENEYLREQDNSARGFGEIVGESPALCQALEQVKLVAPTDANVIILGESGTGKELIARAVHEHSERGDGPLIRVNCAAVPRELFESEFFGHEKGAFTGAIQQRIGRFELADGGTLFLDEVGEIPIELQGKLLRVLQEGSFERVGEEQTRQVDVRVLAATNRNLHEEIEAGRFREDLYYRLSVFPVELPSLRERREDIPLLAQHIALAISRRLGRNEPVISDQSLKWLCNYDWPGNIRELQNVIERAVITSRDRMLRFETLELSEESRRSELAETNESAEFGDAVLTYDDLGDIERANIERALSQVDWKIAGPGGAAELLGVKPTTLNSKLRAFGIRRRPR